MHELRGEGANVAEALDHDAAAILLDAEFVEGFVAADHHAATSGFASSAGAAEFDGLAGDDGSGGFADVHRISVHDPRHGLLVRADVRGGNVALRTKPVGKFGCVTASEAFQFASRKFARIANDAAFGAAEWNIHHRALPSHPCGERAHFVDRNIGSKANAAFARAPHGGMKNAIPDEDLELTVVHANRNVEGDFFFGIFEIAVETLLESQLLRGYFEARFRVLVDIHFFRYWGVRHAELSFEATTAAKAIKNSHFGLRKEHQDRFAGPREMAGGLPRCMELN